LHGGLFGPDLAAVIAEPVVMFAHPIDHPTIADMLKRHVNRRRAPALVTKAWASSAPARFRGAAMNLGQLGVLLALCAGSASAQNWDFSETTTMMQQALSSVPLNGATLVVMKDEVPIYSEYFGNHQASTREPIASASKWLSAATIAALIDAGQMRMDDTVGMYFPGAPADKAAITLRQLFSHTSGLRAQSACLGDTGSTLAACAAQLLAEPLLRAPGSCFNYGGNSMQIAGRMAELATGLSWDQIFIARIATPLGLIQTDYAMFSTQPGYVLSSNPRIAGGARSSAVDLARLAQMLAQNGRLGATVVLQPATVAAMFADQTGRANYASNPEPSSFGHGLGTWRNRVDWTDRAREVASPGAFGTWPWVDYDAGIGAVLFVRNTLANVRPIVRDLTPAMRRAVLFNDPIISANFEFTPPPPQAGCA